MVSLCSTVKAPMFFQTTANTSIRMVNEEGGSCAACKGQWSRGWLRCRGVAVLCTHGGFLNLLEDEGLLNQDLQAGYYSEFTSSFCKV